jgi:hypothetical protein
MTLNYLGILKLTFFLLISNAEKRADTLKTLSRDKDFQVLWGVAVNPSSSQTILEMFALEEDYYVREYVAKNPNLNQSILEKLSRDAEEGVRISVAGNPSASQATLGTLSKDKAREVREAVAGNNNVLIKGQCNITVDGACVIHVLGDGSQVRHYTYGGDLARGIVLAMESKAALNEDFNLSTEESTTVLQLVETIWAKINPGKTLEIVHDPSFQYDVNKRVPSVIKARKLLDFSATTSLSEMLDEVIPWIHGAIEKKQI